MAQRSLQFTRATSGPPLLAASRAARSTVTETVGLVRSSLTFASGTGSPVATIIASGAFASTAVVLHATSRRPSSDTAATTEANLSVTVPNGESVWACVKGRPGAAGRPRRGVAAAHAAMASGDEAEPAGGQVEAFAPREEEATGAADGERARLGGP